MNCSLKNHSLRNLIDNDYLYGLWIKSQEKKGCKDPKIICNEFQKISFFQEFKKTITLEDLKLWKLRDFVLRMENMLHEWEESDKLDLVSASSINFKKCIQIDFT